MNEAKPHEFSHDTMRYFRQTYHPNASFLQYLRWMITLPIRSRIGAAAINRHLSADSPESWSVDFPGKRTLIVGSGPSLDQVDDKFFDRFDTKIYINFALTRAQGKQSEYFFTTDSGPIRDFIDVHGAATLQKLGPDQCIFAPIFLDQWQGFTPEGRALLTWLPFDKAGWCLERRQRFGVKLPYALRYHPCQPNWSNFSIPPKGPRLPALRHTSVLSAVLFAAMNGAHDIALIGCDFSSGRAASVGSNQPDPGTLFSDTINEFKKMAASLMRHGVSVRNCSWEV